MIERPQYQLAVTNELPRLDRRTFLKASFLATCLFIASCTPNPSDENYIKFLLIADTHIGKTDSSKRQANAEAASVMQSLFSILKYSNFDQVIQLGDMIVDTATEEESLENLRAAIAPFLLLPIPGTHLLGNHDIWNVTRHNLDKTFRQSGLNNQFYGVKTFRDFQIVHLDLAADNKGENAYMPEERIDWLREIIYPDTPTIIFSHEGLIMQDITRNDYFRNDPARSILANGQDVWHAIQHLPIRAIISAHLHQTAYSMVNQTHMISIPSFSERIPPDQHNPAVYSVLEISAHHLRLKSFYGKNCIFNINV